MPQPRKGSWLLPNSKKLQYGILVVILTAFGYGVVALFLLRFDAGDVYPPYSSLRSDPLGSRAFYQSLAQIKSVSVQRNYRKLSTMRSASDTTLFYLGSQVQERWMIPQGLVRTFDRLAAGGGRLIIAFRPAVETPDPSLRPSADKRPTAEKCRCPEPAADNDDPAPQHETENEIPDEADAAQNSGKENSRPQETIEDTRYISPRKHWGVDFKFFEQPNLLQDAAAIAAAGIDPQLPAVSWHSRLYFQTRSPKWKTIYTVNAKPVILQRDMGAGSIILCADSYFFSNEALRSERHPGLLAWFVGANASLVFDESHLGVVKTPGVAALMRNYRLHWFFLAVVLLFTLYVWKNAKPFIPYSTDIRQETAYDYASEKDYTQGLISLLRRNVPARQLLTTCLTEWKKSGPDIKRLTSDQLKRIEAQVASIDSGARKRIDPVKTYRTISAIVAEGKQR
jgi:hypothetical protein